MSYRALVTTSHYIFLTDLVSGESAKIASRQGLYYGITWDTSDIYIITADYHPLIRKWNRPKILVFDKLLRKKGELKPPFKIKGGVHQAHFDPIDNCLWWMSSKDNAAIILKNEKNKWEKWQPIEENLTQWNERVGKIAKKNFDQPDSDIHHLNSVWISNNKIHFVAHNWGPSEVYVFDRITRNLINRIPIGNCIHNVWRENDTLHVCCSKEGKVINQLGETKYSVSDGFIRGAAVTRDVRLFGISEKANRRNRAKTTGRMDELSYDWKLKRSWIFDKAGQVLEVRILSDKDICHNTLSPPVDRAVLEAPVSRFNYVR